MECAPPAVRPRLVPGGATDRTRLDQPTPRGDLGRTYPSAPTELRPERVIVDTDLPDAGPVGSAEIFPIASIDVVSGETLRIVRWGQRLVLRRPGVLGDVRRGSPAPLLVGTDLTFRWLLVKRQTAESAITGAEPLTGWNGTTTITSPFDDPQPLGVVVAGQCNVAFAVEVRGTSNLRDNLVELGGFLQGWRFFDDVGAMGDADRAMLAVMAR
jgi:hypothetical protein